MLREKEPSPKFEGPDSKQNQNPKEKTTKTRDAKRVEDSCRIQSMLSRSEFFVFEQVTESVLRVLDF